MRAHARERASPGQARSLVQRIAEALASAYRLDPVMPANGLAQLCDDLGIRIDVRDPGGKTASHGELRPEVGGFVARVYDSAGARDAVASNQLQFDWQTSQVAPPATTTIEGLSRRGVFSLAHEVGHGLFYRLERVGAAPTRLVPRPPTPREKVREEGLCEDFAAAFLLPDACSAELPADFCLDDIVAAWRRWPVPVATIVRRAMYDWHAGKSTVVMCVRLRRGEWKLRAPYLGREVRERPKRREFAAMAEQLVQQAQSEKVSIEPLQLRSRLAELGVVSHWTGSDLWFLMNNDRFAGREVDKPR